MEDVILVDENDNAVGVMEKLEVHRQGKLHRAFSILVFNSSGDLMLQRRARTKYHSGGLWTNTCCSHPKPGDKIQDAVRKQLHYEMGIEVEPKFIFKFKYHAKLDNNLIENEFDHVFTDIFDGSPKINMTEAEDWRFEGMPALKQWMKNDPDQFTVWFRKIVDLLPENIYR